MSTKLAGEEIEGRGVAAAGVPAVVGWIVLAIALLAAGLWNLDGPEMWWDEGWTLSVARNWAEGGHYGRLRDGALARPGLEAAYTVTLPIGATMRMLGIGLWQGRLFGALAAMAATLLLAALAARAYDRRIAVATVAAALLLTIHPQIHPLLQGRQVLAEMPMLAYLLAGYLCLWWALAGRALAALPAAILLGLAWVSKGQTPPFLTASLVAPLAAALLVRRWYIVVVTAATLAGTALVAAGLRAGYALLVDPSLPPDPIEGLLRVMAVVPTTFHRLYALGNLLMFGLPAALALLWGLRALWRERAAAAAASPAWFLRLTLLAFCGSWLAWYLALSVGVPRYMAPPVVVASIFVAVMLRDLTGGFAIGRSIDALGNLLTLRRPTLAGGSALLALALTAGAMALTLSVLADHLPRYDRSAQRVAAALNALPAGARVETYESELHFLLDQPYTYPPDQLHVELGRRSLQVDPGAPVFYDPLANNPTHLVVGRFAGDNDLYAPALASGAFRLVLEDGLYKVYERAP